MKKIKSMRAAVGIVVAALLTTCLIGGTFAKYTSGSSFEDGARVAYWGFEGEGEQELDLFRSSYTHVESADEANVIAPGTSGSADFSFAFVGGSIEAPEVDYTFGITVTESCSADIKANPNIQFKLDDNAYGSWDDMIADIKALSGDESGTKNYVAGTLPEEFATGAETHTISWQWLFTDTPETNAQNAVDTAMGNKTSADSCSLKVSVTATQID